MNLVKVLLSVAFFFLSNIATSLAKDSIGDIIKSQYLEEQKIKYIDESTLAKLQEYNIYNDSCQEILKRLVILKVEYYGFDKKNHYGEIVTFDTLADSVFEMFKQLKNNKIPVYGVDPFAGVNIKIENAEKKLTPLNNYNFTGSFACRNNRGNKSRSMHSIAMAIDINPLQNPFLQIDQEHNNALIAIHPRDGAKSINKKNKQRITQNQDGFIGPKTRATFAKYGFTTWGGDWNSPIDYHHFEISKPIAYLIVAMPISDGKILFEIYKSFAAKNEVETFVNLLTNKLNITTKDDLITAYNANRNFFIESIIKIATNNVY